MKIKNILIKNSIDFKSIFKSKVLFNFLLALTLLIFTSCSFLNSSPSNRASKITENFITLEADYNILLSHEIESREIEDLEKKYKKNINEIDSLLTFKDEKLSLNDREKEQLIYIIRKTRIRLQVLEDLKD